MLGAEGDVLANGVAEQECLLRNKADVLAQHFERELANRPPIDQHRAFGRVVDARNQRHQRGLARSGWSDDRQAGAFGHAQVDVLQHRFIAVHATHAALGRDQGVAVVKAQIAELDLAADLGGRAGCGHASVGDLGLFGQHVLDAAHGRGAALEDVDDPAQRDDRPGELHHVGVEGHEAADRDAMQQDFAAADPQHDHDGDAEQGFQRRPQHAHQAHQLQTARDVFGVLALEALDLRLLLHVGANQPRSGKVLLRLGRDVGEHGLDALEALVNLAAEVLHHDADHGQRQEGEQREPGADAEHEHQRARGEHHGVGGVHDAGPGQHAHRVQIVGGAGHDVAGARALIKTVRQPLQMA